MKFKEIPGYPDYLASSEGFIFSKKSNKKLIPFISNSGYEMVTLCNGKGKKFSVHRLIAITFLVKIKDMNLVDHIDGNRLNNRLENLRWVNHSINNKSSYLLGKNNAKKGEDHRGSILTNEQVKQIKQELEAGVVYKVLAKKYNVSTTLIGSIKRKKRRVHA